MAKLSQNNSNKNSPKNVSKTANNLGTKKAKRTRRTVPRDSPPQRSSIFRGVTRHRWTGRYEAHLWDKNCWNEAQNKKGRQVYLGAYDDEETAARAYDLAALKYWGQDTILNFPLSMYENDLKEMDGRPREEYIGSLRRKSSGFSRGVSKYRGVARHHHNGRWEARIGRVFGNKYLYLGTYATQEEAAIAYDMAAIEYRGLNAVTNFDLSRYIKWLKPNSSIDSNKSNPIVDPNSPPSSNDILSGSTSLDHLQPPPDNSDVVLSQPRAAAATSALGLLLQSSKFKEMMEMTLATEYPDMPPESDLPQSSIPRDIKMHFESNDLYAYNIQGDNFFEELNSFMPSMVQFDFLIDGDGDGDDLFM